MKPYIRKKIRKIIISVKPFTKAHSRNEMGNETTKWCYRASELPKHPKRYNNIYDILKERQDEVKGKPQKQDTNVSIFM